MSKIFTFLLTLFSLNCFSQNVFFDDFSTANLVKIDGQIGYSSATPSLGNGTGACAGVSCLPVNVVTKSLNFLNFGTCTQAINPVDGVLATGDGPGKSLGSSITSGNLYVAMLVNFSTPSSGTIPTASKQVIRFMDNSFTVAGRVYIKQITGGGAFQIGIDKNTTSSSFSASSYSYNQDHLIILKYRFNTSTADDIVSVFVDPDISQAEPNATVSVGGGTDVSSITRIAFPWNVSSFIPNGYIGMVSVSRDWNNIVPQVVTTYSIEGKILSPLKIIIQNAKIGLTSLNTKDSTISNGFGSYNFTNLSSNDFNIKATKNNDITKANGITSIDVLLTQRHILNTTKLNSAYKLIAADVTGDKNINSTDVLRMKRLILGTDTTFTSSTKGNRLWEFVDSSYIFPDTTNPFPFKDSISFTNLTSNKINQTFIGVKLGDVNYDWNPLVARGIATKPVELVYEVSNSYSIQNPIRVKVAAKNFKDLVAMQYTLHFNNKEYDFVGIENNKLSIDFNEKQATQNGNISFLWTDKNAEAKTLEDGTELFNLVIRAKQLGISNLELGINSDIAEIEAWDKDFNQHNIILTKQQKLQTPNIEQWTVSPNPTSGNVVVNMVSKENKIVVFELSNAQGKTLYTQSFEAVKGNNFFNLNLKKKTNLPSGLYFLKAVGLEGENVKKIIIIN